MRFKQAYKVQLCALKCCPELERLVSIQYLNINWNISQWKSYKNFLQKYCYASLCKYIVRNALQGLLNWQVYNFHYTLSQAAECWQINSHTTFKMKKNQQQTSNFWEMQFPSATFYKDKCQWKPHLFLLYHRIWNISNEIQDSLKDRFSVDAVYLHGIFIMAFRSPDSHNVTQKILALCHQPLKACTSPQRE